VIATIQCDSVDRWRKSIHVWTLVRAWQRLYKRAACKQGIMSSATSPTSERLPSKRSLALPVDFAFAPAASCSKRSLALPVDFAFAPAASCSKLCSLLQNSAARLLFCCDRRQTRAPGIMRARDDTAGLKSWLPAAWQGTNGSQRCQFVVDLRHCGALECFGALVHAALSLGGTFDTSNVVAARSDGVDCQPLRLAGGKLVADPHAAM
jgi:hypothetical protein